MPRQRRNEARVKAQPVTKATKAQDNCLDGDAVESHGYTHGLFALKFPLASQVTRPARDSKRTASQPSLLLMRNQCGLAFFQ